MRFIYTKTFAIFASCIVMLCFLVLLQLKGWLYPIRNTFLQLPRPIIYVTKSVTGPVKNFFTTIYQLSSITKENVALSSEVLKLKQDLAQLEQEKIENEALRKELGFVNSFKSPLVPCTVLSKNPIGITDALVLNCGTSKGVGEGQAVVSQGYLVGKIIYAGKDSSTALLINSSNFSADAKLSKDNTSAVVRGSFGSGLVLDQLPQASTVEKGSQVVTAGINEKIPKGISIGEVGDVLSTPNDLFKKTTLLSPINLDDLTYVFVSK